VTLREANALQEQEERRRQEIERIMTRHFQQIAATALLATLLSACASPETTATNPMPATATQESSGSLAGAARIYAGDAARIDVFNATASGNPKPLYSIVGAKTRLNGTAYFLYYQKSKIWVGDQNVPLLGFDSTDRGNAAPQVAIAGSMTGLIEPTGVYVTSGGEIVAADYGANSISTFAPGSKGNAKPERTISGGDTQLDGPVGLTVDAKSKKIYVVNYALPTVLVFDLTASGDVKPLAVITGKATHLTDPIGAALDAKGALYVTNSTAKGAETPAICVFAATAKGNAKPIRLIAGTKTTLFDPLGIAVDAKGFVYTADGSGIKTFAPGANGNVAPVRTIGTSGYFGVTVH
jgi:nitrous oxide reductase accessory protein NosL